MKYKRTLFPMNVSYEFFYIHGYTLVLFYKIMKLMTVQYIIHFLNYQYARF
jgi:hypothetical protein